MKKYDVRIEISQNGEYTSTFLKDKEGRDIRIGNLEGTIINELQNKLNNLDHCCKCGAIICLAECILCSK